MWSLGSATDNGKLGRSSRGGESGSCNAAQHTEGVTLITEVVTIEEGVPEYKCISFQGYKKKKILRTMRQMCGLLLQFGPVARGSP